MEHPPAPHRPVGHEAPGLVFVVMLPTILRTCAAAQTYLFIDAEARR
jgi:hypothetical protein